ncbi:hypothetical protein H0H92_006762 [Tricholoma furcatifolium]|nr:hypothetical protein H0H92_006762 [Tricholoma furcatifolium]
MSNDDLNISLESHLIDSLRDLETIVSQDIADTLSPYLASTPPPTIPYAVLRTVSQWAQSTGLENLRSHTPPLDPHAYSMIALLAGTTTSPERNFGTYAPPPDAEELATARTAERKSITALLNGLLSVFGAGFAVWWAADKLRWKDEWRVLLALFASIIVAIAEAVLYLIWQSQRSQPTSKRSTPSRKSRPVEPKMNNVDVSEEPENSGATGSTSVKPEVTDTGLRRRH